MPLQRSLFNKVKTFIFGNIPKNQSDTFLEVNTCSKCEIRSLYLAELKKHYKDERDNNLNERKQEQNDGFDDEEDYLYHEQGND